MVEMVAKDPAAAAAAGRPTPGWMDGWMSVLGAPPPKQTQKLPAAAAGARSGLLFPGAGIPAACCCEGAKERSETRFGGSRKSSVHREQSREQSKEQQLRLLLRLRRRRREQKPERRTTKVVAAE